MMEAGDSMDSRSSPSDQEISARGPVALNPHDGREIFGPQETEAPWFTSFRRGLDWGA